ncbi:hypothetical protein L1049_016146 [Liquidambar formosana]|uniref:DUF4283 domain-containing protein n=1 Tax=Liquidambar formosana TaxID=63359 RepID=A0AAP0X2L7_LIQFO
MGPWFVSGSHMIVKEWSPNLVLEEVNLSMLACWVQVYGLPRDRKTPDNILKIGALIGHLLGRKTMLNHRSEGVQLQNQSRLYVVTSPDIEAVPQVEA